MMNLIPQQMLKDPACANNQTLIQLCKGVIYEGDKQRRLNAQMHNERYKQVSTFSRISPKLDRIPTGNIDSNCSLGSQL